MTFESNECDEVSDDDGSPTHLRLLEGSHWGVSSGMGDANKRSETETQQREGTLMKIAKADIPVRIDTQAAVARDQPDFGDATDYGSIAAEYFTMEEGTDITPLLEGLEDDLCQSPHWGYVVSGAMTVTYTDGSEEIIEGGDVFYLPPGHTARAEEDAEFVQFSPQQEHGEVIDHIRNKLEESG